MPQHAPDEAALEAEILKHVRFVYSGPFKHDVWLSCVNLVCYRARAHCQQRRSLVSPNQGFWRSLCAFEEQLGITERQAHFLYMISHRKPNLMML